MQAVFKEYNQGQGTLFPMHLDSKIAEDSPVRLVSQVVDKLDISEIIGTYHGGGTSAYHPRMMLKVVLYCNHSVNYVSVSLRHISGNSR